MAEKIKAFFQKKVKDTKFKNAGKGYSLNETKNQETSTSKHREENVHKRREQSQEAKVAGQAALSRLQGNKPPPSNFKISQVAIQKQVRRELENQKLGIDNMKESNSVDAKIPSKSDPSLFAIGGVFYRCSIVSDEVLSKEEWLPKVREFIKGQIQADDEGLAACLIIRNCNIGDDKINKCIDILCKYLENIVNHPQEQKYWKIRMSNKVFQEKVKSIDGALDLLEAAGFTKQTLMNEGHEEEFLVWNAEISTMDNVSMLAEAIRHTESIELELDRNIHVFLPNQTMNSELPPDFFSMSISEINSEQHSRTDAVERSEMLVTKAYREREKQRNTRIYKFSLIRVRFPDGIILQGTFSVGEEFGKVLEFVRDNLAFPEIPFAFVTPTGTKLSLDDSDKTLSELNLVPAVILVFSWNMDDTVALPSQYLKQETLQYIQNL